MPVKRKRANATNNNEPAAAATKKTEQHDSTATKSAKRGKGDMNEWLGLPLDSKKGDANAATVNVHEFHAIHDAATINCNLRPADPPLSASTMLFTHGAGGDHNTPAVANFADGFVSRAASLYDPSKKSSEVDVSSIICFKGPMNLKTRTAMFHNLIEWCNKPLKFERGTESVTVLGGRSMGARAAVLASKEAEHVEKLVLVSYPLQGQNGEIRDQILLEIDERVEVLFLSGTRDQMCGLQRLEEVRKKMKARSWLVSVEGADHGMNCRQKKRTQEMQQITGRVAADWVAGGEIRTTKGDVGQMDGCKMTMSLPIDSLAHEKKTTQGSGKKDLSNKRSNDTRGSGELPSSKKAKTKQEK